MITNLVLGTMMLVLCLGIQCFVVSLLLRVLVWLKPKLARRPSTGSLTGLLMAVMLAMVACNLLQASLWACLFLTLDEFSDYSTAFYHSVVNFTTLGYGDIVLSEDSRLLGAFEAGNGILMLGLTTSLLFAVLQAAFDVIRSERWEK